MHKLLQLVALSLLACAAAAQAQLPDPLVRAEGLNQATTHVWVIPDNSVPLVPNVGIVVGTKSVLVIDTGLGPRNGATVLAAAQKLAGARQMYLVATHFHPEHDLGAQAFPASTLMIRSADQRRDISEFGLQLANVFSARSPINAELLKGADYRTANISFGQDLVLDLGGVRVSMYAMGPNHTRGDIAIWVETDRVLFAGDIAMRAQPAFASPYSSLAHWLESLDRLQALKPVLVVPSHGPSGGVELIEGYRAYLNEVRDRATVEKRAGKTAEQAADEVNGAMSGRYPDRGRLAGAVKAAYAEAK
ncbi:MAG TPA: MBL fold metallo-hydrolase [Burkholderiales bacterium]|nr:MBL fold metallo-hydrolase [Burkholderiales bacterium]